MIEKARDEALTPLERDVLLHSSGELPWTRRLFLGARLRRSAKARRLRDDLRALSTAVGRTPSATRTWIPVAATAAFATVVMALLAARAVFAPADPELPVTQVTPEEVTQVIPEEVTVEHLLIASMQLDFVPAPAFGPLDDLTPTDWDPILSTGSALLPNLGSLNDFDEW